MIYLPFILFTVLSNAAARFTNQVHHLIMVVQWEETTASSILTSVLN